MTWQSPSVPSSFCPLFPVFYPHPSRQPRGPLGEKGETCMHSSPKHSHPQPRVPSPKSSSMAPTLGATATRHAEVTGCPGPAAEEFGILNGPRGSRFQQTPRSRRTSPLKVHSPFPSSPKGLVPRGVAAVRAGIKTQTWSCRLARCKWSRSCHILEEESKEGWQRIVYRGGRSH